MSVENLVPPTQTPNQSGGPTAPARSLKILILVRLCSVTLGAILLCASLVAKVFEVSFHQMITNRILIFGAVILLITSAVVDAFLSKHGKSDSKRLTDFPISWKDSSKKD